MAMARRGGGKMMTVNANLEFSWKYKDYELKACPKRLARFSEDEPNETIDLIKYFDYDGRRLCYSLAYFIRKSEGYDLRFVGNRPFEDIAEVDVLKVWEGLKTAQAVLDAFFRNEEVY